MSTLRTRAGLGVLVILVAFLGHRLWSRGFGLRLGAAPSTISGPHQTEADWAVGAVAADIADMLRYARGRSTSPEGVAVALTDAGSGLVADVTVDGHAAQIAIDGRHGVWDAVTYRPVAARLLEHLGLAALPTSAPDPTLPARLLDADAAGLERESERLGGLLGTRMLDPTLHEEAALLLVAFSLRESADRMSDDRPQLLRILAHLAIASALRGETAPGFAGAAAAIHVDHLAGRGRDAERAVTALAAAVAGPEAAWGRILATRIDEDWRRLQSPASFVERREAVRARLRAAGSSRVIADIFDEAHTEADWGRIVRQDFLRVDAGTLVTTGLARERAEIVDVWQVSHPESGQPDPVAVLDGARIGAITAAGPRPLSWGLWSRFFERHLVAFAARVDTYYRHSLADNAAAERTGAMLDTQLGGLDLYAVATSFRTRGTANGDADLRLLGDAIGTAIRRPELVPAAAWTWLEVCQRYEPLSRGMPTASAWFAKPSPRLASLDLFRRLDVAGHRVDASDLESFWREAPKDYSVADVNRERRYAGKATPDQIRTLFGARLDYDLRARRHLVNAITAPAERVPVLEGSCAMDAQTCLDLARALVEAGREPEAAATYARALGDERLGAVVVANHAGWLIDYWRRNGHVTRALELADRAAGTGAGRGVTARAWLFECLDRLDEAEEDYLYLGTRYQETEQAVGFYYRMARVRKLAAYEPRLQAALPAIFPKGLQPLGDADARTAPSAAVQVTRDSELSRRFGIQAGDLIVGVDGWRVESLKQYQTARAFSTDERMRVVLWRGVRLDVDTRAERRWFNIGLRTYPIQGWAE